MESMGAVRPRVVFVGLSAAGKSTVGRLVAGALRVRFRDINEDISRLAGTSIQQVVLTEGTARFRELDERACLAALSEHPGVVSLGAGSVLSAPVRAVLAGLMVCYLMVSPLTAAGRIATDPSRAVRPEPTLGRVRKSAEVRCPLYERVATFRVSTDDRELFEVAAEVLGFLV